MVLGPLWVALAALLVTAGLLYVCSCPFVRLRLGPLALAAAIATAAGAVSRAVADAMPTLIGLPLAAAAALGVWAALAMAFMPRDLQMLAREAGLARTLPRRGPRNDGGGSSVAG